MDKGNKKIFEGKSKMYKGNTWRNGDTRFRIHGERLWMVNR